MSAIAARCQYSVAFTPPTCLSRSSADTVLQKGNCAWRDNFGRAFYRAIKPRPNAIQREGTLQADPKRRASLAPVGRISPKETTSSVVRKLTPSADKASSDRISGSRADALAETGLRLKVINTGLAKDDLSK